MITRNFGLNARARMYLLVAAVSAASLALLLHAPKRQSKPAPVTNPRTAAVVAKAAPPASKLAIASAYGNLPLRFEANRGQADPRVRFLARGADSELFLAGSEAVLVLRVPDEAKQEQSAADNQAPVGPGLQPGLFGQGRAKSDAVTVQPVSLTSCLAARQASHELTPCPARLKTGPYGESSRERTALRFSLEGADPRAQISGREPLPGTSSYFIGNDSSRWVTGVPNFARVAYHQIYPGVDLVYYGSGRNLEFDFEIAPHADPSQIRLKVAGANSLQKSAAGEVLIATPAGEVRLNRPEIYQRAGNRRKKIAGAYALAGNNEITLQLGPYDKNRALIFDPVIQYSTFLGGTTSDVAESIFVDSSGNAYITGETMSTDFPTTSGVLQNSLHGTHNNVFISKLNNTGAVLLYSTYLGGTGPTGDFGSGIAVDSQGDAFVAGTTSSPDFPSVNPFQATLKNATGSAFVAELNPSATALLYSTFLGGSGAQGDFANALALDSSGSAYVTGVTSSKDFPLQGPIEGTFKSSGVTAFVSKFSPAGSSLVYSTYLGGSGLSDAAFGIALDTSNDAFVTGGTDSGDFPTTTGAFQTALNGSGVNAFLTEVNSGGSAFSYSTYLGGSSTNGGNGSAVALDSMGAVYLTGSTTASDFPVTGGAAQSSVSGSNFHAFVSKIDPAGKGKSDLIYSTYLSGSNGNDQGSGIAVDSIGSANVTGIAASTDFPATPGAMQAAPKSAGGNAFITRLNPAGSVFLYSSTFGGSSPQGDAGKAIALDSSGAAYVVGAASSSDFPTTQGSLLPNFRASSGNSNGFVTKLAANAVIGIVPSSLDFGRVLLKIPSNPQLVTFTNNSTATLNFSSAPTLSGAQVAEYSSATNCGASLAPNAACTVTVSFLPTVEGTATASLTFTDDDPSSPQVVPITGLGALDFTLTGPGSESVAKGQSITFSVTVTPVDMSTQTVNLTCTGAPMDATCTLSPTSITLDGVDAVTSTVTVTASSQLPPLARRWRTPGLPGMIPLAVLTLAIVVVFAFRRRRAIRLGFAAATLACVLFAGCGSSGGAPTGMFTLVITGTPTDGGMVHTANVTLTITH